MPVHVLHVAGTGERGGAESVLLALVRHLDRGQVEPSVVCLQEGPLLEECRRVVPTRVMPAGRLRDLRRRTRVVRELSRVVQASGARVVHCHGTLAYIYGGAAARRARVTTICHVHDVPADGWSVQRLVERWAFRAVPDVVVAVSRYVADRLPSEWRRRAQVVPNGVPVGAGRTANREALRAEIRERFGWSASSPLVLWCGRLQRWKGPHIFLEAARLVSRARTDVRFLVVGGTQFGLEPAYARYLHRLRERLELQNTVALVDWQPDVSPFLAAADLLVHSSVRPEPFGLVIAEAQALETPVIAAAAGGPLELVVDGETGLLTPPGDSVALGEAILELLEDPDRRARLAAAGRARIAALFSADQMARRLEAIYLQLVSPSA